MKIIFLKKLAWGLGALFITSGSYAKCYPGLDCPDDLPDSKQNPPMINNEAGWEVIDYYMVKGGLVKDLTTGLMWMRCSFGQTWNGSNCEGQATKIRWDQAMSILNYFSYEGHSDWRLPDREELKSLVYCSSGQKQTYDDGRWGCDGDYQRPTIKQSVFPNTPKDWFWSSSPGTSHLHGTWIVNFYYGFDDSYGTGFARAFRLVRLEQ